MRFIDAKAKLKERGLTIRKQQGEYRVAFSGPEFVRRNGVETMASPEDSAYYTTDLDDAVATGLRMADE